MLIVNNDYSWGDDETLNGSRWKGIKRGYKVQDVVRLQGKYSHLTTNRASYQMSSKLWSLLNSDKGTRALGASTPAQAVQMVLAGLTSIYLSGWQVAADVNGDMYPDQSLYPCDRVPKLLRAINNALLRQDVIDSVEGESRVDNWLVPIIADGEAGFGGVLNVFEMTKKMIEAGAAAVHFEDQLSSEKKCGHLGGKVLVPTQEFINKLRGARLAADVAGTPLVIIARTDANSAKLITSNADWEDNEFIGEWSDDKYEQSYKRTEEGFYPIRGGLEQAIQRGLAYAPYADALWCETSKPDIGEAREFAQAIHEKFPGKLLAYNCSPSFNWSANLSHKQIDSFQDKLIEMGYKFQFVTLAGFHALNHSMYSLAKDYETKKMAAYANLQDAEFKAAKDGYDAVKHQRFVGTDYFDTVRNIINDSSSTGAMTGSTEKGQF